MARYIDAEHFVKWLADEHYTFGRIDEISEVLDAVSEFPGADVAPVAHAHWIEEEDCTAITDIPWSMCSACGSYSLKLLYCAFCGAKMDEEADNE